MQWWKANPPTFIGSSDSFVCLNILVCVCVCVCVSVFPCVCECMCVCGVFVTYRHLGVLHWLSWATAATPEPWGPQPHTTPAHRYPRALSPQLNRDKGRPWVQTVTYGCLSDCLQAHLRWLSGRLKVGSIRRVFSCCSDKSGITLGHSCCTTSPLTGLLSITLSMWWFFMMNSISWVK